MIPNLQGIILAAGKSSRFNTGKTKLLELLCGKEVIFYPIEILKKCEIPITIVLGHHKETIQPAIEKHFDRTIQYVEQTKPYGTGHALWVTQHEWVATTILVINGDTPLITASLIQELYQTHKSKNAAVSFVTAHNTDPETGYGRVVTIDDQLQIIEAKHFKGDINQHCCINAGIYLFEKSFLKQYLQDIIPNNEHHEWYITDLIHIASKNKLVINTLKAPFDMVRGINTLQELWTAEQIKRSELIKHWMERGVRFIAPQNSIIDVSVSIGAGSLIGSGVHLYGNTTIGNECTIKEFSILNNVTIENNVLIKSHSVLENCIVKSHTKVGPFAHIHTNSIIEQQGTIGNFVELKATTFGTGSKAKHLSYLGDTMLGKKVNIGAGTVTCNHDGFTKHKTHILDGAYIGSNNTLVAPITIEENTFTGAGSTITKNVPANTLAIARAYQINKEGYALKLRLKKTATSIATLQDGSEQSV